LNAPDASLLPVTAPGFTVTVAFGKAPPPSTRNCELCNSDRVTVTAASAVAVPAPNATMAVAATASRRNRRRGCRGASMLRDGLIFIVRSSSDSGPSVVVDIGRTVAPCGQISVASVSGSI
jgi:hypothetical protein